MVMLTREMRTFCITMVRNKNRPAWMVNYAEKQVGGRWKRRQNLFWNMERAQEFLERVKREALNGAKIVLGTDRALHGDALRAARLITEAGLPSGSLTVGVQLLIECRSDQEKRKGEFLEPRDRKVDLSPRSYLALAHEARESQMGIGDLLNGIVWGHIEERSRQAVQEREKKRLGKAGSGFSSEVGVG